jgi:hypothetical protein
MANQETKILDNIISSRRAMLLGGGALAAIALAPKAANAAATVSTYTDADILNFALNLEYLEANFYYLAAFGTTIDVANAASIAAGGPAAGISITSGSGAAGGTVSKPAVTKVPFTNTAIAGYAVETAIEEGKHVLFLKKALGTAAVAQPNLDLNNSFNQLASAAGIGPAFNPYATDANFLIGAYIFEDVGVTAYQGAASLITAQGNLGAAASILAVEAYHAGLIRTTINGIDPTNSLGLLTLTQQISALRAKLSLAANSAAPNPDDFGTLPRSVTLTTAGSVTATQIVDADANVITFPRNTTQVLNIVTGGGATVAGQVAKGVFFPNGLNGLFQ